MAIGYSSLCYLLSNLEAIACHDPPFAPQDTQKQQAGAIETWFRSHRRAIDALDAAEALALISALLPERRVDRVYGLQSTSLSRVLGRAFRLSSTKLKDLHAYREPGHGDLAECLARALEGGGPPALPVVSLHEIDRALDTLASHNRFSDPQLKSEASREKDGLASLANIFQRLPPAEAKWLVRLILKDLSPVHLNEHHILKNFHFLLPDILRVQQDFRAALTTLKGSFRKYLSCPDQQSGNLLRSLLSSSIIPHINVKVSRAPFCKARSIEHCLQITGQSRLLIERKYDGEFCEMHIDLSKGEDWLKIFSKSGKDSTADRHHIKNTLKRSISIGSDNCRIKQKCILLGEMVVYSDRDKQIMPFHKLRKYIARSGTFIGTAKDSPRHSHEHLMIVFFDLLLLDDLNVMQKLGAERKTLLQSICKSKAGRAMIAESRVLDFSEPQSKEKLIKHFAASVAARHEGLILKPCGRPYLSVAGDADGRSSVMIKLKKDYINGLGDEADMAVIGASYDAQLATSKPLCSTTLTHFHLGCLTNPVEVDRWNARPLYKVVGSVAADGCIPPIILAQANDLATFAQEQYQPGAVPSAFDLTPEHHRMDVIITKPFVFEVLGSSYEKPSGCDFWMLRHPRVKKLHHDRTWRDCVSFCDLQKNATEALAAPVDAESQENLKWIEKIEQSCRRKQARASLQTTPCLRTGISPRCADPSAISSSVPTSPSPKMRKPLGLRDNTNSLPTPPTSSAPEQLKRKSENTPLTPIKRLRAPSKDLQKVASTTPAPPPLAAPAMRTVARSLGPQSIQCRIASCAQSIAADSKLSADDKSAAQQLLAGRSLWRNVPQSTIPTPGRCAFLCHSTGNSRATCALSGSTVCIPHSRGVHNHDVLRCRMEAELHGAHVVYDHAALLTAGQAGRRMVHFAPPSEQGGRSASRAALLAAADEIAVAAGSALGTDLGSWMGEQYAVQFIDVEALAGSCAGQMQHTPVDLAALAAERAFEEAVGGKMWWHRAGGVEGKVSTTVTWKSG